MSRLQELAIALAQVEPDDPVFQERLFELRQHVKQGMTVASADLLERALSIHGSDDVEIDDGALTSETSKGAWVQAWVYVEYPLVCPECGGPIWDLPEANKLAKCWNSAGHASGAPLAFDPSDD